MMTINTMQPLSPKEGGIGAIIIGGFAIAAGFVCYLIDRFGSKKLPHNVNERGQRQESEKSSLEPQQVKDAKKKNNFLSKVEKFSETADKASDSLNKIGIVLGKGLEVIKILATISNSMSRIFKPNNVSLEEYLRDNYPNSRGGHFRVVGDDVWEYLNNGRIQRYHGKLTHPDIKSILPEPWIRQ